MLSFADICHSKRTAKFGGLFFNDFRHLPLLLYRHHMTALFHNTGLLCGNLSQGISQKLHMIHADGRQYGHTCILHHICGVQQTSHSGFHHHDIAAFFLKIQEAKSRFHLKWRRLRQPLRHHFVTDLPDPFHVLTERSFGNHSVVYLNPLSIFKNNRGNIFPHPIPAAFQCGCNIGNR
jgi:hypothetical protein